MKSSAYLFADIYIGMEHTLSFKKDFYDDKNFTFSKWSVAQRILKNYPRYKE